MQDTKMEHKHTVEKAFCGLLVAIYTLSAIYFITIKGYSYLSILLFCMVFTIATYVLHTKVPKLMDKGVYITLCSFVLFASLLGTCFKFYDLIKWYDDFLHLWSGIIFTQIGFVIVRYLFQGEINPRSIAFILIFSFMFTMGCASLWEIWEFLGDTFLGLNTQVGGLVDTCVDMIDALIGAAFIMPHIYILTKRLNTHDQE